MHLHGFWRISLLIPVALILGGNVPVSEGTASFAVSAKDRRHEFPWRRRHLMRLQVPRALLTLGCWISVSSATHKIFLVVHHLGLTEWCWKWGEQPSRFQRKGLQARSEGAAPSAPFPSLSLWSCMGSRLCSVS